MSNGKNDADRFHDVYEKYYLMMYHYCLARLFNDADSAHDACTDIFMAFGRQQDKIEDDKIKAWLYSAAEKSIKNMKRKYARRYRHIALTEMNEYDISVELFDDIAFTAEHIEKVQTEIMESLQSEEKALFRYKFVEGKNIKEIAEILNVPYDTVYYRVTEMTRLSKKTLREITDKLPC